MPEYDCMGNVKKSDNETPCFLQNKDDGENNIKEMLSDALNNLHDQWEKTRSEIKIPDGYELPDDKKLTDLGGQFALYMCMPQSLVKEVIDEEERRSRARVLESETTFSINGVSGGIVSGIYFNELLEQENGKLESLKRLKNPAKCEIAGTLKGRKYTDVFLRVVNRSGRKNEDNKEAKIPKRLRNGWK